MRITGIQKIEALIWYYRRHYGYSTRLEAIRSIKQDLKDLQDKEQGG